MIKVISNHKNYLLTVYLFQCIFQMLFDNAYNYLRQKLYSCFPILQIKGLEHTEANDFPKVLKSQFSKAYLCDCRRWVFFSITLANNYVIDIQQNVQLSRMIYLWLWLKISSHAINKISLHSHLGHMVKATFIVYILSSLNFPLDS